MFLSPSLRYITILTPEDPAVEALGGMEAADKEEDDSIDLRTSTGSPPSAMSGSFRRGARIRWNGSVPGT